MAPDSLAQAHMTLWIRFGEQVWLSALHSRGFLDYDSLDPAHTTEPVELAFAVPRRRPSRIR
jgi:hypothetical protein